MFNFAGKDKEDLECSLSWCPLTCSKVGCLMKICKDVFIACNMSHSGMRDSLGN
jgi:hypothetical protein